MKSIDIVLPCYNPPANWTANICENMQAIADARPDLNFRLYIVNDGSPCLDALEVVALRNALPTMQWLTYDLNYGKGYALRKGIAATTADIVVFTDIDFPYELESMVHIIDDLEQNTCDIAVGVRPITYYEKVPFARRVISKTLRSIIGLLFNMPITDTQCGLKGFNRKGKVTFLQTTIDRYLFDLEFIFLAAQDKKLKVKPIEVHLKPNIIFSSMNYKILGVEGRNFLKILFSTFYKK